jgi:arylsulfatase A-like enzyme
MSIDWMPTLLAAAGIEPEARFNGDGENLLSVLEGKADEKPRTLYWRIKHNNQRAIRQGDWKYLKVADKEFLFDLSKDEREQANLAKVQPEKMEQLKSLYEEWNSEMIPYPEDSFSAGVKYIYSDRY